MLPPQITPVGGRLSNFVEGWKRIMNDPYIINIVAKGYRLRFTSPPLLRQTPWEIRSPQGPQEILRIREQITLMLQKNAIIIPGIPGTESFRRVAFSYRSKESERPYSCTSFPYVHDKLCAKLCSKRRLLVQNRPAGCVLSCTYSSQQQEVPQVRLRKQGVAVSGATIRSEHSPSAFYSIGAHGDKLFAPSGDLGDTISRRLVDSPPRPPNLTPTSSSTIKYARPCRLYSEQKEVRAGPDSGSTVSGNPFTSGPRGSFPSRVQSLGDSCTRTPSILPPSTNLFSSVPAYGVTQLGLRSYPPGSFVPETLQRHFHSLGLTDRFTPPRRSDPLELANLLRQWQDLHAGVGAPTWGIPRFRVPGPQAPHQLFGVWGTPEVNMFATLSNSHLPRFMSPIPEPRALAVNALSQDWQGRSMYMFPQFPLLNKVIQKLRSTQAEEGSPLVAESIVVSTSTRSLCGTPPSSSLPSGSSVPAGSEYISDGKSYHLHALRLSCDTIKQQVFQARSLGSRQPLGGLQPNVCTTIGGFASLDGPQGKDLIHLTPQLLR